MVNVAAINGMYLNSWGGETNRDAGQDKLIVFEVESAKHIQYRLRIFWSHFHVFLSTDRAPSPEVIAISHVNLTSVHSHLQFVRSDHLNWAPTVISIWFPLILAHSSCVVSCSELSTDNHVDLTSAHSCRRRCVVSWIEQCQAYWSYSRPQKVRYLLPCWAYFRSLSPTGSASPPGIASTAILITFPSILANRGCVASYIEHGPPCWSNFHPFSTTGGAFSSELSTNNHVDLISIHFFYRKCVVFWIAQRQPC